MTLAAHRFADLFPMMDEAAFAGLRADIERDGLTDKIVLFDGQILDGRNRYKACVESHVTPHFERFRGTEDEALRFVVSKNLHRRHLTTSQRALVAANISGLGVGRPSKEKPQDCGISIDQAATMLNVSPRSVETARIVRNEAVEALIDQVQAGRVSVAAAADVASLPAEEQKTIVAQGEKEILQKAKEIRAARRVEVFQRRVKNLGHLADTTRQLTGESRYAIVYADPAWKFLAGDGDRAVENHYPTMTRDELLAHMKQIDAIALKDALLVMWGTASQLPLCLECIAAAGFSYKSMATWDKKQIGTGYWFRDRGELLFVATRGDFPAPLPGSQLDSVIEQRKGEHSEKPLLVAEWIERCWPGAPRIELNCRNPRPGWDVWGNQSDGEAA